VIARIAWQSKEQQGGGGCTGVEAVTSKLRRNTKTKLEAQTPAGNSAVFWGASESKWCVEEERLHDVL
jgi:hypothetical protein